MKQKVKKVRVSKLLNVALFAVSVGFLLYFCISDNNLATLLSSIPTLSAPWLAAAAGAMLLFWLIDGKLVYLITSLICPEKYSRKNALKVTMVGQFFNAISPFSVAGQPMQVVTMVRQGIAAGVAFSILIQKFLIYQTTLTLYSLLVIIFRYQLFSRQIPGFMSLALIGFVSQSFVVVMLFLFSVNRKFTTKIIHAVFFLLQKLKILKRAENAASKLEEQLQFYLQNSKAIAQNKKLSRALYSLTFLQLTAIFSIPFFIYKAFHQAGFPVFDMISAQAFVTMISCYTPLPGASGTSEGSFLVIFNLFFAPEITKQAMLLWRFITYYSNIIVGSVFAGFESKKEKIEVNFSSLGQKSGSALENAK